MKKEQMFQELLKVYSDNEVMFDDNKLDKPYLKWLDKIKTYDHTRSAYRFMFKKLYLCIITARKVWDCHTRETWSGLKIMNRGCNEVLHLQEELRDFRIVWNGRPRFKRNK